jgi:alanyl-tRNA synthetase
MTIKRYLAEPATLSGTATVTQIIAAEKPIVRLAETWFHPQGGGQKADRGTIGPARVIHAAHNVSEVDHFVDDAGLLKIGESYPFEIDLNWRRLNAAYHTAGHLVASIVESKFPLRALAGHQWPDEARVEFDGAFEDFDRIKAILHEEIHKNLNENLDVQIVGDPYTDRAIKIGTYGAIPCGGTH